MAGPNEGRSVQFANNAPLRAGCTRRTPRAAHVFAPPVSVFPAASRKSSSYFPASMILAFVSPPFRIWTSGSGRYGAKGEAMGRLVQSSLVLIAPLSSVPGFSIGNLKP